ncbi:hypothetical protein KBB41_00805 [Candidatus Curtissbacteria bacterium]|nr:hypothetical protein [Candidatus Curtissbacteria bacterium]
MNNILLKKSKPKGTTFVEVLLYIALLSIVIIFITDIILQTLSFMIESRNISYLDSDARFISTKLRNDIRRADSISIPATIGETTEELHFVFDTENYSYTLADGVLQITDPNGTYRINSNQTYVDSFSVKNTSYESGSATINFDIVLQSRTVSSSVDQINISFTANKRE